MDLGNICIIVTITFTLHACMCSLFTREHTYYDVMTFYVQAWYIYNIPLFVIFPNCFLLYLFMISLAASSVTEPPDEQKLHCSME